MLVIISPAKTIDDSNKTKIFEMTEPKFLKEAEVLASELKQYEPFALGKLMKMSDKLVQLNKERYEKWHTSLEGAKQCILSYKGEVFRGIDIGGFNEEELFYTDSHLRVLSGLYGVLEPLNGIQPYRLEMCTKLSVNGHKDLYDFWGDKIRKRIAEDVKKTGDNILVNLASYEYYKCVEGIDDMYGIRVVTPVFKDYKDGEYKIITMKAKKARGLMTSFIMKNQLKNIDDLKKFDENGYKFSKKLSSENEFVFINESK